MTGRMAAVTLVVRDYDTAIAFYCGALGFELLEDTKLSETKRWVRVAPAGGGAALLLARAEGQAQQSAIGNQTGGRVAFFLETEDFGRDHQAFTQAGVSFLEAPRHETYGIVAVFADPFGNRWDLIEHTAPGRSK
ncbi:VOC family protein [Oricola indica]|jgi:catechol 2,3-dioxygenase-like lactoylglutathione lyase family enzyme|uniref:VOC family protein n=1 Tax=Oricola indica TaxID=2872591 RepID=UPI001CC18625|nr:VOC family protein [Oricola indica]